MASYRTNLMLALAEGWLIRRPLVDIIQPSVKCPACREKASTFGSTKPLEVQSMNIDPSTCTAPERPERMGLDGWQQLVKVTAHAAA